MGSPTLAELECHATKFGVAMVMETASANGFSMAELALLRLRLFEIESQQPKKTRRRRVRG
jgi:hypothetical protein